MFKFISKILQGIVDGIGTAVGFIINLFPSSPFEWVQDTGFGDLIAKINYFIPVIDFVTMIEAWLVCIALYYAYSVYARWVKAIN